MEEHAVHQECVHVLQDGLVTIVNKVRRDVGMSDIYLMIILKTSMNVMVIMSVIKSVLTLMDLLCVHVMMGIFYKLMEELVKVRISDNGHTKLLCIIRACTYVLAQIYPPNFIVRRMYTLSNQERMI